MSAPTPARLVMDDALRQTMTQHVQAHLPEEACGLVGGAAGADIRAACVLPVENLLHSPTRYRMEPRAQLQALQALEQQHMQLVGIFHSHPNGPAAPSARDLAEFAYPGAALLILSPHGVGWQIRAFWLEATPPPAWAREIPLASAERT